MKRLSFLLSFVLVAMNAAPAAAQHQQHGRAQQADTTQGMMSMMQGGGMMQMHMQMMEQAMQNPLMRAGMLVRTLPTMQPLLELSDEQVTRLQEAAQQFKQQQQAHMEQMAQVRQQLQNLLASEDAAPDRVRSLLEEVATHHARMQALAYETASQMKGVLSAEQRTRLSEMTPMQMHRHMMANMTMMEMMQAMHGGMMPGGMMGMMQGDMMNRMQGGMMQKQ